MSHILIQISVEEFKQYLDESMKKVVESIDNHKNQTNFLTRKETAFRLRISLPTLNEYTKSGKLKGYRINGRVLYKEDEVNLALTAVEPLKYRR